MGTLKHSLQRRNHRERAQPVEREKWGLLEKPKDYRLRAQDYQSKQLRLKRLREKAANKNPDEFYFGMLREKTKDGIVSVDRGHSILSEEALRLLKTQDAAYIRTMFRIEEEKIKKLEKDIYAGFQGASNGIRKHHYFIDEDELEDQKKYFADQKNDVMGYSISKIDTDKHLVYNDVEKTNLKTAEEQESVKISDEITTNSKKLHELNSRKTRLAQLSVLEKQIDVERKLQTKGERRKIGISPDGVPIYQWKLERKR